MTWMNGLRLTATMLAFVLGFACGDPEEGDGTMTCEHGTESECACPDGSMGTQLCAHDTSGFEACECGGDTDITGDPTTASTTTASTTTSTTTTSSTSVDPTTSESSGDPSTTTPGDTSSDDASASSSEGPVGQPPVADIFHPSDGEDREVDVPIPWTGSGEDTEDGVLTGASLVWSSDLDGEFGQGEMFDAALATLGTHTITLVVSDSDGNTAQDSIQIEVVAP